MKMTIDKAYIYKRKDGETIFCYGELNEGDNIDITLDCDADELDGVACDIDVTDPKTNTWKKICEYLENNYSSKISDQKQNNLYEDRNAFGRPVVAPRLMRSETKRKKKDMELIVEKKSVYGNQLIYPVCNKAKLFASISGNKTLLPEVIEDIKKLGYKLTTKGEQI
jgi:hypothetical protein